MWKISGVASVALWCLSLATAQAQQALPPGDPAAGHTLALQVCAACHVVADDQPYRPILHQKTPSFREIANSNITPAALRTFLEMTHSTIDTPTNMPNPQITDEQATNVISYIASLRTKH